MPIEKQKQAYIDEIKQLTKKDITQSPSIIHLVIGKPIRKANNHTQVDLDQKSLVNLKEIIILDID